MAGVSAEQIREAKEADLLAYLQAHEPHNLVRDGPNRYTLADHDSFVISNSKWNWNSKGYGRKTATALNYLIDVRGMSFADAVKHLTGDGAPENRARQRTENPPPPEKASFRAPEPIHYAGGAVAYLQRRGVSAEIVGKGRFRQQAEFVVWGSNGSMPGNRDAPVLPGVFRQSMPALVKRRHQTEKPLEVMREMLRIVEPGGIVLDPFAGAGTTVLAAKLEGYPAVGIELSRHYAKTADERIKNTE